MSAEFLENSDLRRRQLRLNNTVYDQEKYLRIIVKGEEVNF